MILEDGSGNRLAALANAVPSAPETDDDWVMTEFGLSYLIDDEFVDLADITELKLVFNNGAGDRTRLYIDNIRLVPYEPRRGAVAFTADDGNVGQLATMRPVLREYGFPSTHFNMKSKTGHDGQLSRDQLKEIAAEPGCRVSPHPQHDRSLPQMPDDESHAAIEDEYAFHADELGLGHEHARYMSWPRGASDTGTIAQAREFHDLAFDGVAGATAGWTSAAPMSIARASFDDLDDLIRGLDIAEHYGRVFTPQFHRFRDDLPTANGNVTPADFQTFVDEVASRDLDVIPIDELARVHEQG
jgi:peptidoglycan/xylan/chitin deacetylase (PgdA/CDA1 family)